MNESPSAEPSDDGDDDFGADMKTELQRMALTVERFIWSAPAVDEHPVVALDNWSVMQLPMESLTSTVEVVLVGRGRYDMDGRVSTSVLHIDRNRLRARTASGRIYELSGRPNFDPDGMYILSQLMAARGRTRAQCVDISDNPAAWPQADGEPLS